MAQTAEIVPVTFASGLHTMWAGKQSEEEKKRKRKLQNRINQRSRRARASHKSSKTDLFSVQIHRWRVEEHAEECSRTRLASSCRLKSQPKSTAHFAQLSHTLFPISEPDLSEKAFQLSISSTSSLHYDRLLHLIHFNVVRGLNMNKTILDASAVNISRHSKSPIPIRSDESFYGCFVIKPTVAESIPSDLVPTDMQLMRAHITWINLFPFSQIRDNLIRWHDRFSHQEFARDVLGTDLVGAQWFRERKSIKQIPQPKRRVRVQGMPGDSLDCDDDVTADRQGLILWGEPHWKESWEATPGFLRKWMWVVDGCDDLITSTNDWRRKRGEDALRLVDVE